MEKAEIRKIVSKHRHEKAAILAILHEVQAQEKQLEMESLRYISEELKVPFANVYGVATFYSAFSTSRKGETEIRICDGICCHIKGSDEVIRALTSYLDIEVGETSWDEKYSMEKVQCLGLCAIGPNVSFNAKTYPKLTKEKIRDILQKRMEDLR